MGKLDEQIKALQRKKAKIDLFERIILNLDKEGKELSDFPGLMKEVAESVQTFCKAQVSVIENESAIQNTQRTPPAPKPQEVATAETVRDVEAELRAEIESLTMETGKTHNGAPPAKPKKKIIISEDATFQDPLKFIVHFRDWMNKSVLLKDDLGHTAPGELVGAAFPNLKVRVGEKTVVVDPKYVSLAR